MNVFINEAGQVRASTDEDIEKFKEDPESFVKLRQAQVSVMLVNRKREIDGQNRRHEN